MNIINDVKYMECGHMLDIILSKLRSLSADEMNRTKTFGMIVR